MIVLKSQRELEVMMTACRISAQALQVAGKAVEPGISTGEIDRIIRKFIEEKGAKPTFLNYNGFPASSCISVNNEVIHGIPDKNRYIQSGDLVSIDLGACINGYTGDTAATFAAGDISQQAKRLMVTTEQSLYEGIKKAVPGGRLGDIGYAIQGYCEDRGFSVVREFTGHGVGAKLHEDPAVPNYGTRGRGIRLMPGMTLAIEPMINNGTHAVKRLSNNWTIVTQDGELSAHFEHTVAITSNGPVIMTKVG
ncbi:MAG: Methionine aminopeptidase 1 [Firmicutes bacterium ADurb.Bin300]|nr:MAG: Methionine aminopeptidase 1 [Firmicutes bacterium ADurb.Bin300]HOD02578.1 type I methionyl aminopeptidase [Clostridiales bacterium]